MSEAEIERASPVFDRVLSAVATSSGTAGARRRVEAVLTPAAIDSLSFRGVPRETLIEQFSRAWFRYFVRYDPAMFLAQLDMPILAINGSLDQQVPADENLAAIAAAVSGSPDATIRKLDGLNHMFQTAETGALGEYSDIAETFSPVALDVVSSWINARFGFAAGPHPADAGTQ